MRTSRPSFIALPITLEHNLARVRRALATAADDAGRSPEDIELVAVTKTVSTDLTAALCRLGQTDLGENRVDVLEQKAAAFRDLALPCRWHFVGHVQRNKARRVAEAAHVVHSVDSVGLIESLDRGAENVGRSLGVYLQVKFHPEETKTGLAPESVRDALATVRSARALEWLGWMTMAPLVADDPARAAHLADTVFAQLAAFAREQPLPVNGRVGLSMGMSDDFAAAIRHGATCVRIGSSLFTGLVDAEAEA